MVEGPSILIAEPEDFSPEAVEILSAAGRVDLEAWPAGRIGEAFARYDVVWIRLGHRVRGDELPARPRCRWLVTPTTGLDHVDLEACAERGIEVLCLRGEVAFLRQVRATAELTVGLALALLRHLPGATSSVLEGRWDRDPFRGAELYGKTAGIVGMGRLGTIVAGYLRALGMEVQGYDPRDDFPHHAAQRVGRLDDLLATTDLVSLHVAYGPATHHLLSAGRFAATKPGAYLINTSRGGIVDGAALLAALESGRLAGAALDVVEGEPDLGIDHPLVAYAREHDNLLLVPHIGGNTAESFVKTECFMARKVVEALTTGWRRSDPETPS
ncbi:MAG: hydroxyacid dehydrogenase [Acidobacteria bacterium]|nr:hydroxyacid dehydrogenase [Acidobacteriota bacterium]